MLLFQAQGCEFDTGVGARQPVGLRRKRVGRAALSAKNAYPAASGGSTAATRSCSREATVSRMSMIGFALMPVTAVLPKCFMARTKPGGRTARIWGSSSSYFLGKSVLQSKNSILLECSSTGALSRLKAYRHPRTLSHLTSARSLKQCRGLFRGKGNFATFVSCPRLNHKTDASPSIMQRCLGVAVRIYSRCAPSRQLRGDPPAAPNGSAGARLCDR